MDSISYASLNVWENLPRLREEPDKEILAECDDGLTPVGENIGSAIADAPDSNMLLEITPSMMQKIASLPQARREKILRVWERLVQGTYDLDERLDAVIDRILNDITT